MKARTRHAPSWIDQAAYTLSGFAVLSAGLALAFPMRAHSQAQAPELVLEPAEIFDGGLFVDGDIEIVNGKIILKNVAGQKAEPAVPDPAGPQILELTDGSQLHGRLVSFGRTEVVWERTDASAPLVFSPEELKRIVIGSEQVPDPKKAGATIKLDNSDWLAGELVGMKDGKFQLQIAPDTQLEIDRARVEWLALSPSGPASDAYEGPIGPMGLSGWDAATGAGGAWDYADGALVAKSASPISRSFTAAPERMDLEFTAGDGGTSNRGFTLWIRPGTNVSRGYTKGAYYLRFQASTVSANFYTGDEIKNFSANLPTEKDEKKMTRYRLLVDRKLGRLIILVNGKQAADWDLPETKDFPREASVSWQPNYITSNMAWTLSNVRVRPWDGKAEPDPSGDETAKDTLSSPAEERKSGTLDAISAESVTFAGAEIPRKEPLFIRLTRTTPPEPPPSAVAHVWLASRGDFDVIGIGFKDGKARIKSAFGSDLVVPQSAIGAIEFPHKSAVTEKGTTAASDRVVFRNGDQMRGSLVSGSHDKPLQWKPIKGDKIIEFKQDNLAGVLLTSRAEKAPAAPASEPAAGDAKTAANAVTAARLRNGDWIVGELLALTASEARLKSAIGEDLTISRPSIANLYLGHSGIAPVYDAASDRAEWIKGTSMPGYSRTIITQRNASSTDPWRYLDGAFSLSGSAASRYSNNGPSLGRILKSLPAKVDVGFEISTSSGQASYSIQLFFDENKPGFMVQGGWDSAYLYDMSPRQQGGVFFNQPQQIDFGEKVGSDGNTRRFRFLSDRDTGRLWMFVNGEFVGAIGRSATSKGDNPKPGKGIAIVPRPGSSSVTVSNIWIAPWSGSLPPGTTLKKGEDKPDGKDDESKTPEEQASDQAAESKSATNPKPADAPANRAPTQDSVALANGDDTIGTVLSATAEVLKMECDVGEIEVPMKRTSIIEFGGKPTPPTNGIRFRFADNGALTVDSFNIENGNVTCKTAAAGELKFPLSIVSEIVWSAEAAKAYNAAGGKSGGQPVTIPAGIQLQQRLLLR